MEKDASEPKGLIARWKKQRTLRKQIRCIGRDLARDHGKKTNYSTAEVRDAWLRRGWVTDYMCYAIVAFTSPRDFYDYHLERGETCDYNEMRQEVGDICANGNLYFSIDDLVGFGSDLGAAESLDLWPAESVDRFSDPWLLDPFSTCDSGSTHDDGDCGGDEGSSD
jgi:hypothetical protein